MSLPRFLRLCARRAQGFEFFFILFFALLVIIAIVLLTMQRDKLTTVREEFSSDMDDQHAQAALIGLLRTPVSDGPPGIDSVGGLIISLQGNQTAEVIARINQTLDPFNRSTTALTIQYPRGHEGIRIGMPQQTQTMLGKRVHVGEGSARLPGTDGTIIVTLELRDDGGAQ